MFSRKFEDIFWGELKLKIFSKKLRKSHKLKLTPRYLGIFCVVFTLFGPTMTTILEKSYHTSKNDKKPDSLVYCPGKPPFTAGALMSVKLGLASVNVRPISYFGVDTKQNNDFLFELHF